MGDNQGHAGTEEGQAGTIYRKKLPLFPSFSFIAYTFSQHNLTRRRVSQTLKDQETMKYKSMDETIREYIPLKKW